MSGAADVQGELTGTAADARARPWLRRVNALLASRALRDTAPVVAAALLVLPAFIWIAQDGSIWPWDPAWYGQVSIDLWGAFRTDLHAWSALMVNAFGSKPPAIAWIGQVFLPVRHLTGSIEVALLVSIVLTQAATLALVYVTVRRLCGASLAALVAVVGTAGAPLFVSMSHEFFPEPIQAFAVTWVLFAMASSPRWRPGLTLAHLVGAVALGLLAKLSTPVYVAAPALVAALFAARNRRRPQARGWWRDPKLLTSWGIAAALSLGALGWYRINFDAAWAHARLAAASGPYGAKQPFLNELPTWLGRMRDALFLPWFGLAILGLLAAAGAIFALRRAWIGSSGSVHRLLAVAACLLTSVLVLSLFSLQPNSEVRYIMPLVPCLALALAVGLELFRARAIAVVVLAVLAAQFTVANLESLGSVRIASVSYTRLVAPEREAFAAELRGIVQTTCTQAANGKISMVGADYPWFNANTLTLYADERFGLRGRRCYYTSLGYAEQDSAAAWRRVQEFKPPFYVTVDYGNPANPLPSEVTVSKDAFNRVNIAVYRRVVHSRAFAPVPGTRERGIVVFRATRPHG